MLENITGIAWEDLITDRLFSPLGLKSAYFGCPDTNDSPLGHYYNESGQNLVPVPPKAWCDSMLDLAGFTCDVPPLIGPAGTVYMHLSDWVRYYQWHLAGVLGLDASGLLAQEEFLRLHSAVGGPISELETGLLTLETGGYGYGWMITNLDWGGNGHVLMHGGSHGMWLADVKMAPAIDRVFFAATNSAVLNSSYDALNDILEIMISDGYESSDCRLIDALDFGRNPGSHESCPESIYGPLVDVPIDDGNQISGDDSSNSSSDFHLLRCWLVMTAAMVPALFFL